MVGLCDCKGQTVENKDLQDVNIRCQPFPMKSMHLAQLLHHNKLTAHCGRYSISVGGTWCLDCIFNNKPISRELFTVISVVITTNTYWFQFAFASDCCLHSKASPDVIEDPHLSAIEHHIGTMSL